MIYLNNNISCIIIKWFKLEDIIWEWVTSPFLPDIQRGLLLAVDDIIISLPTGSHSTDISLITTCYQGFGILENCGRKRWIINTAFVWCMLLKHKGSNMIMEKKHFKPPLTFFDHQGRQKKNSSTSWQTHERSSLVVLSIWEGREEFVSIYVTPEGMQADSSSHQLWSCSGS